MPQIKTRELGESSITPKSYERKIETGDIKGLTESEAQLHITLHLREIKRQFERLLKYSNDIRRKKWTATDIDELTNGWRYKLSNLNYSIKRIHKIVDLNLNNKSELHQEVLNMLLKMDNFIAKNQIPKLSKSDQQVEIFDLIELLEKIIKIRKNLYN